MLWRTRHKQRKTLAALQRLFTPDVGFNLSMHGVHLVALEVNGMVLYSQKSPADVMTWVHTNVPSMTDNSWFLYDVQEGCEMSEHTGCKYLYVCCN